MDKGIIKADSRWEFLTFSVDLCEKIIHSSDGIEKAEVNLEQFSDEYVPGFVDLYNKGKELAKSEESLYILKPGSDDGVSGYFSVDLLVLEAIQVYEKLGYNTTQFKRYLNNKSKKDMSLYEKKEFQQDQYTAWSAAAMLLSGVFIYEYQANKIHPLRSLRDYFAELDLWYGQPDDFDQKWMQENIYEGKLLRYGKRFINSKLRIISSYQSDRLGLAHIQRDDSSVVLHLVPHTVKPRWELENERKVAREKSLFSRCWADQSCNV